MWKQLSKSFLFLRSEHESDQKLNRTPCGFGSKRAHLAHRNDIPHLPNREWVLRELANVKLSSRANSQQLALPRPSFNPQLTQITLRHTEILQMLEINFLTSPRDKRNFTCKYNQEKNTKEERDWASPNEHVEMITLESLPIPPLTRRRVKAICPCNQFHKELLLFFPRTHISTEATWTT